MDNQKIVVILLLVTIILSVVSVVITMSASPASAESSGEGIRNVEGDQGVGKVSFEIVEPNDGGGTE